MANAVRREGPSAKKAQGAIGKIVAMSLVAVATLLAHGAWYDNPVVRASFVVDAATQNSDPHYINKSADDGLLMVNLNSAAISETKRTVLFSIADLKTASGEVHGRGKTVFDAFGNAWKGGAISSDLKLMIPGSGTGSATSLIETDKTSWTKGNGLYPLTFPDSHKLDGMDFGTGSAYLYSNADSGKVLYRWTLPAKPYSADANTLTLSASKTTSATRIRNISVYNVNGRELVYYGEGSGTSGRVWVMDVTDADTGNWTETEIVAADALGEFKDITNVKLSNVDSANPILYVLSDAGKLAICQLDANGKALVQVVKTLQKEDIYDYANVYDANPEYADGKFRNFEVVKDGSCAFFVSKTAAGKTSVNVVSAPLAMPPRTLTYKTAVGGAWTAAASWNENLAPRAGDTLVVSGNARLSDTDAAAVADVAEIRIGAAATLTVENAEALTIGGCVTGEGRLTKCGEGVLTLKRGSTLSGKLKVEAGTVNAAPPRGAFTWYKWTIREGWYGHNIRKTGTSTGDWNVGAMELVFFDEDGNRLSYAGFSVNANNNVAALQPSQVTYDGNVVLDAYADRIPAKLIDGSTTTQWLMGPRSNPTRADTPASWFSIVLRFPEGTPEAAAYDIYSYGGTMCRSASAWTMYGSSDGVTWFELDKRDFDTASEPTGWMSDGSTDSVVEHKGGFPMVEDTSTFGFKNVSGVMVASGATLAAGRPELKLPLPTLLEVAPGGSHGHFTGFAMPMEGTVNVSVPLSWFRLTVFETVGGKQMRQGGAQADANVQMQEFALYDAFGVRRNLGLGVDRRCNPSLLEPGKVTYSKSGYEYYTNRDADMLFDDAGGNGWCVCYDAFKPPRRDQSSTWICLTMRLAEADPGVMSYDWVNLDGADHARTVLSWRLEGSPDGQTWVQLDDQVDFANRRDASKWWSDGADFVANANPRRTGLPLDMDGMKDLVSLRDFTCAIDLGGCADVKNLTSWKVCINGVEMPEKHMVYRNGELCLDRKGLCVILR